MAKNEVSLDKLIRNREKLVSQIKLSLTANDKKFLISFVSNEPDWSLVRDAKIKDYPSVKWKLMNQAKMGDIKLEKYIKAIAALFVNN